MDLQKRIWITEGADHIESFLSGALLPLSYFQAVVDELLFGGEASLSFLSYPVFCFVKPDRNLAKI